MDPSLGLCPNGHMQFVLTKTLITRFDYLRINLPGSAVNGTCCFSRRSQFSSQHPHHNCLSNSSARDPDTSDPMATALMSTYSHQDIIKKDFQKISFTIAPTPAPSLSLSVSHPRPSTHLLFSTLCRPLTNTASVPTTH